MRLFDAHNHLQDHRLADPDALLATAQSIGVVRMVVNGSCESDWPEVLALARRHDAIIPSFGYHPWYVRERSGDWQKTLIDCLSQVPSAVGEIGLDRWIKGRDLADQEEVFVWQLRLAAERDLPVSIHCLLAWGRLHELLRIGPVPRRGFLLHSYGGPREMVRPLAKLGAYFSIPGYFAQAKKLRQRECFREVPPERLLIETDAPDQPLPSERIEFPLTDPEGRKPINHPANLAAVYRFTAELLGEQMEDLARRIEDNFHRLFGAVE